MKRCGKQQLAKTSLTATTPFLLVDGHALVNVGVVARSCLLQ